MDFSEDTTTTNVYRFATANFKQKAFKFGAIAFLITTFISALIAIAIDFGIIQELHKYTNMISFNNDHKSAFIKYNYHNILLAFSALLSFYLLIETKTKYPIILLLFILIYGCSIFSDFTIGYHNRFYAQELYLKGKTGQNAIEQATQ